MRNNKLTRKTLPSRLNNFGMLSIFPELFDTMSDFTSRFDNFSDVGVNIKETDKLHQIQLSAPGYKKDNFKIDIEDNRITISNEFSQENVDENEKYSYKEFKQSSFSRSFTLPENINSDEIKAKYEDGILYIDIPKTEITKKYKKIEIS